MKLKAKFHNKTIIVDGKPVILDPTNIGLMQKLYKRGDLSVYFDGAKIGEVARVIGGAKKSEPKVEKPKEAAVTTKNKHNKG